MNSNDTVSPHYHDDSHYFCFLRREKDAEGAWPSASFPSLVGGQSEGQLWEPHPGPASEPLAHTVILPLPSSLQPATQLAKDHARSPFLRVLSCPRLPRPLSVGPTLTKLPLCFSLPVAFLCRWLACQNVSTVAAHSQAGSFLSSLKLEKGLLGHGCCGEDIPRDHLPPGS